MISIQSVKNIFTYQILENPCPELGSIVTIKLSELENNVRQKDGSTINFLVETHFQMNYNTGEWKVIQKPPKVDPNSANYTATHQQVIQAAHN